MTKETITITLKNDLMEIERLSQIVTEFGARHQFPAKCIFHVNLALEEILTNLIAYGYDDSEEHCILVSLSVENEELTVGVEDDGCAFNPLDVPEPELEKPLEQRPAGGLGLHLVRNLMNECEYVRQEGKNRLVMRKKVIET